MIAWLNKKGAKNVAARRSSPWQGRIKVHIGKTVQTARSGENEQAPFSENVFWSGLKRKDLTITAVRTKTSKFISFRTKGCYVQVSLNTVEK